MSSLLKVCKSWHNINFALVLLGVNGEDAWLNMVELSHPCHPCHGWLKHPFQGCTNQIHKLIMADYSGGSIKGRPRRPPFWKANFRFWKLRTGNWNLSWSAFHSTPPPDERRKCQNQHPLMQFAGSATDWLNYEALPLPMNGENVKISTPLKQIAGSATDWLNYEALHGQLISALNSGVCTMEGTEDMMSYNA